jgi:hypothetical protein
LPYFDEDDDSYYILLLLDIRAGRHFFLIWKMHLERGELVAEALADHLTHW